ncbi:beta-glucuronidase isoform X2 [Aplysia californica]|uniref:Beta-glucuronidase n=1 Tax=Aplysia californica TaxID=6500 RepID=A0ABM0JE35_APLCA|nr:beta-glucuronidase isoform X2 [Aplysia californica]
MRLLISFILIYQLVSIVDCGSGMLYPRDSESRQTKFLDGLWLFRVDSSPARNESFVQRWWEKSLAESGPVIDMPVPSSYNDVTQDKSLRDFVGWAWYERSFYVSQDWTKQRIVLRFDSAHYYSKVWLNGKPLMEHNGGHLPFESEVNSFLIPGGSNRITLALNNTLTPTTLPPGTIKYETDHTQYPPGYFVQNLQMDFFNYAGIHRHVRLYTTPSNYIDDITILSDISGSQANVSYQVAVAGTSAPTSANVSVSVLDNRGQVVAKGVGLSGVLSLNNPTLWWPFGMNDSVGYRYLLEVRANGDVYRQPFGIRTVKVTENQFLINGKPFYCHGVAKHEDSDLRGKGLDYPLIVKDFNMLRWLGVNCIRTSHYPYAEEILELADSQGVAVIDESPGVGINQRDNFGQKSLDHHKEVMSEMIRRDKNKPSVIMWSVANEPASNIDIAVPYFKSVIEYTRVNDPAHRPVTFVCDHTFETEKVVPYVDVICLNRYYGWYSDPGHTEVIQLQLKRQFEGFRNLYKKPIIITEYGADTIPGLHRDPSFMFTEEYQEDFLSEYHQEFDRARKEYLIGEMVWNFADFMTVQGVKRVVGNKKGLLTRQRQPKRAAFLIRDRYYSLIKGADTSEKSCKSRAGNKYSNTPHVYTNLG